MEPIPINYLAVLVAVIIRMALGALWYSPLLFVRQWQALTGVSTATLTARLGRGIAVDAITSLIMAFALANIVGASHIGDWANGAGAGFWVWLGFVATTAAPLWAYEDRPTGLLAINLGYNLVSLVLMGALLAVWQ